MANRVIGDIAKQEIRHAMCGLRGSAAKSEAERLATLHGISWQHVYTITKDQRAGLRKPRADKGKRTFELVEGTDVWSAASLVVAKPFMDPDQALQTVQIRNPEAKLPSLEYFRNMLAEKQLGKKARRTGRRGHRRWEAEFPGQIFQVDVTALKVRWQDEKTRRMHRIDGIDKNHPMQDETKVRVWQIMLVDDCSRRRFLRYVATRSITSRDMVQFECEAYSLLGVPHELYTDNGSEFKGHHIQAEKLLNIFLKDMGGYVHKTHAPNNPQATGKVEGAHKWAEKMDRYIGLAIEEGQKLDIDHLNLVADRFCEQYNNTQQRTTGQTPMERWHSKRVVVRKIEPEVIESALLSQSFPTVLDASMTVACGKAIYKVPGVEPFVNFVGQKVDVVVPPNIDVILVTLPDGSEYEIDKLLATADKAGEFRSTADSNAQTLKKRLTETRKEEVKVIRETQKLTGMIAPVPHVNVVVETPATNVAQFPQPEHIVTAEEVAAVVPIVVPEKPQPIAAVASKGEPQYVGKPITYWQAVVEFSSHFDDIDDGKQFLLGIFPGTTGTVPTDEVEAFIEGRDAYTRQRMLKAV